MGHIVITGASSDIGLAITKELSELDKPMILHCSKNREALKEWEERATIISADFSSNSELDFFISKLGDVEILVNAAASTDTNLIPYITSESLNKTIQINIVAFTKITQAVIPKMCINRRGNIINISSVTAKKVYRGQAIYAGSKAYMEAFTKAIVAEYGKKGVRSNCVAPGSINSGTLKRMGSVTEEQIKQLNAVGKLGLPKDVAKVVRFLCNPDSSYINGTVIETNGGHWMGI